MCNEIESCVCIYSKNPLKIVKLKPLLPKQLVHSTKSNLSLGFDNLLSLKKSLAPLQELT